MTDLVRRIEQARDQVRHDWSDERIGLVLASARRREQRRRLARAAALLFVASGAGTATLVTLALRAPPAPVLLTSSVQQGPGTLRFQDGSVAELWGDGARLESVEDPAAGLVRVELPRGGARFDVVRQPARRFQVRAGQVTVEVLGTSFSVEHATAAVSVSVTRGSVRVTHHGQEQVLAAGESRLFNEIVERLAPQARTPTSLAADASLPAAASEPAYAAAPGTAAGLETQPSPVTPPPSEPKPRVPSGAPAIVDATKGAPTWRTLAQEGQFEQAWALVAASPDAAEITEPGDLLLLADTARLARQPQGAVAPLKRFVAGQRSDPRSPLALFTLGRVLLDDLGDPRAAAEAFAQARALEPAGPMAQDALAREVEAWSRAGDKKRAHEQALQYVQQYPGGRRLRSVQSYGGLQE